MANNVPMTTAVGKRTKPKGGILARLDAAVLLTINAIREAKEQSRLELNGREFNLTHLNKVYFPRQGYTKRDVLLYYAQVSPFLLPFLRERPLVLHRYPNGISENAFYQKEAGPYIPEWIRTVNISSEAKQREVGYFLIDDLASLLYISNLGCIEHNPFATRADDLEKPDYMFVDLDPTEGTDFSRVVRAASLVGEVLDEARLKSFVKTSGATGLHIFIPVERKYGFEQARAFLEIVALIASERESGLLTRTFRVQDRPRNTVFFDVRQNAAGQSLAAVFSLRPREGAPASTPLAWSELKTGLKPGRWDIKTVLDDLPGRAKLWRDFWKYQQRIEDAVAALEKARG
jgi:bifunctional non-homologous end joining protein LigD